MKNKFPLIALLSTCWLMNIEASTESTMTSQQKEQLEKAMQEEEAKSAETQQAWEAQQKAEQKALESPDNSSSPWFE